MKDKVIKGKSLEDKLGKYIPYCNHKAHEGIVRYSQVKQCEARNCQHYVKYRFTQIYPKV